MRVFATLVLLTLAAVGTTVNASHDPVDEVTCGDPQSRLPETGVSLITDGGDAVVTIDGLAFTPACVSVMTGAQNEWRHTDGALAHNPANGVPGNPSTNLRQCFDFAALNGRPMREPDVYPVRFQYDPAAGLVSTSPDGGTTWKACPAGTSVNEPSQAVIPYHCTVHTFMRGRIVVNAT